MLKDWAIAQPLSVKIQNTAPYILNNGQAKLGPNFFVQLKASYGMDKHKIKDNLAIGKGKISLWLER